MRVGESSKISLRRILFGIGTTFAHDILRELFGSPERHDTDEHKCLLTLFVVADAASLIRTSLLAEEPAFLNL